MEGQNKTVCFNGKKAARRSVFWHQAKLVRRYNDFLHTKVVGPGIRSFS